MQAHDITEEEAQLLRAQQVRDLEDDIRTHAARKVWDEMAASITSRDQEERREMVHLAARVYWEVIGPAAVEVARVLHTAFDIGTAGDDIVKLARQMDAYRRDG